MTIYINGTTGISGVDGSAATPALQGTDTNTGIAFGSDVIIGSTGGSERWRTDASGRVLVGTSTSGSTGSLLQVRSDTDRNHVELFRSADSVAGAPALNLSKSRGTAGSPTEVLSGDALGYIAFRGYDGAAWQDAAYIYAEADGSWTDSGDTTDNPSRLVFSTCPDNSASPVERLRIGQDGNVLIGTTNTATGARLYCLTNNNASAIYLEATNASQTTSALSIVTARNTTNASYYAIEYYNSGASATRFRVADSGNVQNTNNSYTGISDVKLKENIVDASSQWDDIKALKVRNYNFKEETGQSTHRQIGLVAQEVEEICPGLVGEDFDRDREGNDLGTVTKNVNYSVLYMKAVKALQEAMERIEALEAEVAALKAS